jgi:hypothetical protein
VAQGTDPIGACDQSHRRVLPRAPRKTTFFSLPVVVLIGLSALPCLFAQQQPLAAPKAEVGSAAPPAAPDKPQSKAEVAAPAAGNKDTQATTPPLGSQAEREATALNFLRAHHPELVELVERLKNSKPAEYERAIRESARTSDRLASLKQRDPERYALELEAWKLKSQIRLLAARASMQSQESLADEIRAALERQYEVRLKQLELDRADLAERLQRVETTIDNLQKDRQGKIDKQLETVLRGIDRMRTKTANRNRKRPPANTVKQNPPKKKSKGSPNTQQ